jgi:hypothetical protein
LGLRKKSIIIGAIHFAPNGTDIENTEGNEKANNYTSKYESNLHMLNTG